MKFLGVFKERVFILILFCLISGFNLVLSFLRSNEPIEETVMKVIALVIYSVLSVLSIRGNKVCTLAMGLLIGISGIGTVLVGVFIPVSQTYVRVLFMLIGSYFTYGGIELLRGAGH